MKKALIVAAAWLLSAPVMADGIDFFHGSFEEALAKAKAQKKLVFVDVYTTWCGPCKMMALNVFPKDEVGEFFNAHFVSLKLDSEDKAVNGPEISARYGIRVLPTYLFIDPDGTEKHRGTGFKEAEAFINLARASLGTRQDLFSALEKRYQAGERKPDFIREYLKQARYAMAGEGQEASREGAKKVFDEYIAGRKKKDLINAEDFSLLESYLGNAYRDDEYVDFVANNYDAFIQVAPESRVAFFLLESVKHSVGEKARKGDPGYVKYIQELDGLLAPAYKVQVETIKNDYVYREYLTYLGALHYFTAKQDWQGMLDNNKQLLASKGSAATARDYSRVGSGLHSVDDPAILEQAVGYAKKAYELEPSPRYALDYAGLLRKLKRNAEALQVAEKGLASFDPKNGQAYIRQGLESLVTSLKAAPPAPPADAAAELRDLMSSRDPQRLDAAFEKGGPAKMTIAEVAAGYWVGQFLDPSTSAADRKRAYDRVMKYGTAMAADETAIDISGKTGVKMIKWKGEGLINTVQTLLPGKPMPDFGFTDLNRKPVTLADHKGKVILLDFWATWCKPCVASMPSVKQFREELRSKGQPFEVISVDAGDAPEKVMEFQKTSVDMPWVNWHQETFTKEYFNIGLKGLPTYFVLDAEGRILSRGSHFDDAMKHRIRAALNE